MAACFLFAAATINLLRLCCARSLRSSVQVSGRNTDATLHLDDEVGPTLADIEMWRDFTGLIDQNATLMHLFAQTGWHSKPPHEGSRAKPMLWWHVHKVAGTYMCQAAQVYDKVVSPNGNCNWREHDMYPMSNRTRYKVSCADRASYFARRGATWGAVERAMWPEDVCSEFDYGTLLRDPIALMQSAHNFVNKYRAWSNKPTISLSDAMQAVGHAMTQRNASFPDPQLGAERTRLFDNFQVRVFSGRYDAPFGGVTRQDLEGAKSRLQEFRVLGVLEDLASSGNELFRQLGWPARTERQRTARANAGSSADAEQFRAADVDMLTSANSLDYELYEFVRGERTFR